MSGRSTLATALSVFLLRTPVEAATKRGIAILKTPSKISNQGLRISCSIDLIPRICLAEEGETPAIGAELLAIFRVGSELPKVFRTKLVRCRDNGDDELRLDLKFLNLLPEELAFLDETIASN